jgi:exoribonuclease R
MGIATSLFNVCLSHPDFKGRSLERIVMNNLLETNAGSGLCHAWYSRRFLESVSISHVPMPHSGLGLDCYVQWTSPIRRFSDLQVHAAVKRYLRRQRVYDLIQGGEPIPEGVSSLDFGISAFPLSQEVFVGSSISSNDLDNDLDYLEGLGLIAAGKKLQRLSQQYWLFEYIRRLKEANPDTTFSVVVLGCVDPDKHQFAIYVKELGLEHRYSSPAGRLEAGAEFRVKVDNVAPRSGLLSFVRVI